MMTTGRDMRASIREEGVKHPTSGGNVDRGARRSRMMTRTVSLARLILLLVVLGVGCAGDVESLDRAMSELVEGVPQSLLVPVKDTQICPSASACAPASHEHRIDRSL